MVVLQIPPPASVQTRTITCFCQTCLQEPTSSTPTFEQTRTGQQNQLSRFTYKEGDLNGTRSSEKVLATSATKDGNIHSGGWVGFKPSSYGKGVRDGRRVDPIHDVSGAGVRTWMVLVSISGGQESRWTMV